MMILQEMPPEAWGDRFHRAYRLAKRRYGRGFTYREVARRVSAVLPTNDAAIIRLESHNRVPPKAHQRALAVYCVVVYGFQPGAFELTEENIDPRVLDRIVELVPR